MSARVAAAVEPAPVARIELRLAISVPAVVIVVPLNSDTGAVPVAAVSGVRLSM